MTPRTLDWRSVERKLTRMRRLLDRLVALGPFDRSRLVSDDVPTLAAERILTLLVDLAFATNSHVSVGVLKQAPDSYRESFSLAAEAGLSLTELALRWCRSRNAVSSVLLGRHDPPGPPSPPSHPGGPAHTPLVGDVTGTARPVVALAARGGP